MSFEEVPGGYILTASVRDDTLTALLPKGIGDRIQKGDLSTTGRVLLRLAGTQQAEQVVRVEGIVLNQP